MLEVKIGREITKQKDRVVEAAIAQYVETKSTIDVLNGELKTLKESIVQKARDILGDSDAATITFGVDDDRLKIGFGYEVNVSDDTKLKDLLGSRFDDLVSTTIKYKPDIKLKVMALDDDGLKECLSIKEKTPTVAVVK